MEFGPTAGLRTLHQYFDLKDALGRPADPVEFDAVRNPYMRASINRSRELVYAA